MHHALEIEEILLNIFGHYRSLTLQAPPGLADIARTCRTFKEPALDVLWEELYDLSPLVRCLPEACHRSASPRVYYSYSRPLTDTEWDRLRSYTCRIRYIQVLGSALDQNTLGALLDAPTAHSAPLFPNLRRLDRTHLTRAEAIPLSRFPLPSLISLELLFQGVRTFQTYFDSFPNFSQNIKNLSVDVFDFQRRLHKIDSSYFCQWKNLQSVRCPEVTVDEVAFVHLSRMPALTELAITLSGTLPASNSPLCFSNLHHLSLHLETLTLASRWLSRIQIPLVTHLCTSIGECPFVQDILPFLSSVQTSSAAHAIEVFSLDQWSFKTDFTRDSHPPLLDLDTLRPCTAFSNLRRLNVDLAWNVALTDSDLLRLASAWPHLEQLSINAHWGWNTPNGITPDGLCRLLETCRALDRVALAMDTRGYTECVPSSESPRLTLPSTFSINVLDSPIERECVAAVAEFFASIAPCPFFAFDYRRKMEYGVYSLVTQRWKEVYTLAVDIVSGRMQGMTQQ